MSDWDGKERRNSSHDDLIIQTHTILLELKEMIKTHFADDKEDFEKVHKRINKLTWYAAIGSGAILAIEFFKEKIFE